jgi:dihydrodipicolinate reductase
MNFEDQMFEKVQQTLLKQIGDCRLIEYHHSNKRDIPEDIVQKAWASIDWDEVIKNIRNDLQDRVCQTVVQNMLTEVKTDVKKIMSIEGVREKIRMEAYPVIKKAIGIE